MQLSPRETQVALTELHSVSLTLIIEEMKKRAPAILDFLAIATIVLQLSKRRRIKSPQCVWHMWKGAQPYPKRRGLYHWNWTP